MHDIQEDTILTNAHDTTIASSNTTIAIVENIRQEISVEDVVIEVLNTTTTSATMNDDINDDMSDSVSNNDEEFSAVFNSIYPLDDALYLSSNDSSDIR
jgi:hypothetical protein